MLLETYAKKSNQKSSLANSHHKGKTKCHHARPIKQPPYVNYYKPSIRSQKNKKRKQLRHRELRDNYLTRLAEALVLKRASYLSDPKYSLQLKSRTEREVKWLIRKEQKLQLYKKVGRQLTGSSSDSCSLTRVDTRSAEHISSPEDLNQVNIKSWKGPWRSITEPQEIAKYICYINTK